MQHLSEQQLSPTLVVKSLLANGFSEFSFADLHREFKRHFPKQKAKNVYQSLYQIVDRFVKKGYLSKQRQLDNTYIFLQTDEFRDYFPKATPVPAEQSLGPLVDKLHEELVQAERALWVSSSAADQCQQKMASYPQLRIQLSKLHMEYKEKSLTKLGEVEVLRRMLKECGQQ